jgi:periplasmic protein TonB
MRAANSLLRASASGNFRQPLNFPLNAIGIGTALLLHGGMVPLLFGERGSEPAAPALPVLVEWVVPPSSQEEIAPPQVKPPAAAEPKRETPKLKSKPRASAPISTGLRRIEVSSDGASPQRSVALEQPPPATSDERAPAQTDAPKPALAKEQAAAPLNPPSFNADYLHNPSPVYPQESRSQGEQGRVILRVLVTLDGRAERVDVRRSSGFSRLDESARETVGRWRFTPARQDDHAVSAWVLVPISYSLEG